MSDCAGALTDQERRSWVVHVRVLRYNELQVITLFVLLSEKTCYTEVLLLHGEVLSVKMYADACTIANRSRSIRRYYEHILTSVD